MFSWRRTPRPSSQHGIRLPTTPGQYPLLYNIPGSLLVLHKVSGLYVPKSVGGNFEYAALSQPTFEILPGVHTKIASRSALSLAPMWQTYITCFLCPLNVALVLGCPRFQIFSEDPFYQEPWQPGSEIETIATRVTSLQSNGTSTTNTIAFTLTHKQSTLVNDVTPGVWEGKTPGSKITWWPQI